MPMYIRNLTSDVLVEPHVLTEVKSASGTKWFAGVNSIRFVLALIVFLSHCPDPFVKYMVDSKFLIIKYTGAVLGVSFVGIAAVIAFFVISGFVIHYPNKNGIKNIKDFYLRRGIRVLFPLLVITIIGLPLGSPESVVVWSLYCELIYYALYPLMASVNKISWRVKTLVAFCISITLIFSLASNDILSLLKHADIKYNGDFPQFGNALNWLVGLPYWLLGVSLAEKINTLNTPISFKKLLFWRISIYILTVICFALRFHFYVSNVISMPLIALPIAKWVEYEICYYKSHKPISHLERFGNFSYSLYLCHPLIVATLVLVIPLNIYSYFLYIAVTIIMSYVFYLLLEKPSHLFAKKITGKRAG